MTAPLESEEEGSDSTEGEDRAEPVERLPLLPLCEALVHRRLDRVMSGKPDSDGGDGDGTKWKVDVKAPAPGNVVCECTAEKGTDDAGEGEDAAKATEEDWTVLKAGYLANDSEDRDEDA